MSLACPRCGNSLDQDFGLIACPQCGAVSSIDFDGNIQLADEEPSYEATGPQDSSVQSRLADPYEESLQDPALETSEALQPPSSEFLSSPDEGSHLVSDLDSQSLGDQVLSRDESPGHLDLDSQSLGHQGLSSQGLDSQDVASQDVASQDEPAYQKGANENESSNFSPGEQSFSESVVSAGPENFSEVIDFANSEEISALSYDLTLDGILGDELKEKVFTILAESRLQLDLKKVEKTFKDGTLTIKKLSPAKVSFILQHLLDLPISPRWSQHIFKS